MREHCLSLAYTLSEYIHLQEACEKGWQALDEYQASGAVQQDRIDHRLLEVTLFGAPECSKFLTSATH